MLEPKPWLSPFTPLRSRLPFITKTLIILPTEACTSLHLCCCHPRPIQHHPLPGLLQQSPSSPPTVAVPPSSPTCCYTASDPPWPGFVHCAWNTIKSLSLNSQDPVSPPCFLSFSFFTHCNPTTLIFKLHKLSHSFSLSLGLFTCFLFAWNVLLPIHHLVTSYFRPQFNTSSLERSSLTLSPNQNYSLLHLITAPSPFPSKWLPQFVIYIWCGFVECLSPHQTPSSKRSGTMSIDSLLYIHKCLLNGQIKYKNSYSYLKSCSQ